MIHYMTVYFIWNFINETFNDDNIESLLFSKYNNLSNSIKSIRNEIEYQRYNKYSKVFTKQRYDILLDSVNEKHIIKILFEYVADLETIGTQSEYINDWEAVIQYYGLNKDIIIMYLQDIV
mmetsp:Transcript_70937/g.87006  ORF Transcript_70937/g.87006 Transcript_70937/m.87006 type:complete len:121 (+) Transcript_70937:1-363(+)